MKEKLEQIWDKNKELKDNIIAILNANCSLSNSNGFHSLPPKSDLYKNAILEEMMEYQPDLTSDSPHLEILYKKLIKINKSKAREKDTNNSIFLKIDFLIEKIEAIKAPTLKEKKQIFELEGSNDMTFINCSLF